MLRTWLVVFAFLMVSVASAKTYTVRLSQDAKVGSADVKAGEYKIQVDGSKVVFLDNRKRPAAETDAKVETNETKYKVTAVSVKEVNGANRVLSITLGGSTTKLVFGESGQVTESK